MQSNKGCVRLRGALKCIGMHLRGHYYSRVELLTSKGVEKSTEEIKPVAFYALHHKLCMQGLTALHDRLAKHCMICLAKQCTILEYMPACALMLMMLW